MYSKLFLIHNSNLMFEAYHNNLEVLKITYDVCYSNINDQFFYILHSIKWSVGIYLSISLDVLSVYDMINQEKKI